MKRSAVLLLALVLAGCGGGGRGHGTATLWVTQDRGEHVMYAGTISAGVDGIQSVAQKLKVTTRYGGRYVQSIDGVAGSLSSQHDWFFFVDGIEGSRSAAEVRIHPGDVLWWDYRHWTPSTMSIPVVAGAYPHPFVDVGSTNVVAPDASVAQRLAQQVHGVVGPSVATDSLVIVRKVFPADRVVIRKSGDGYILELGVAIAAKLATDENALRYRF